MPMDTRSLAKALEPQLSPAASSVFAEADMSLHRPQTLKSRAWSSTSLEAGVEHCAAMSGLSRKMSRADLLKKLQVCS